MPLIYSALGTARTVAYKAKMTYLKQTLSVRFIYCLSMDSSGAILNLKTKVSIQSQTKMLKKLKGTSTDISNDTDVGCVHFQDITATKCTINITVERRYTSQSAIN